MTEGISIEVTPEKYEGLKVFANKEIITEGAVTLQRSFLLVSGAEVVNGAWTLAWRKEGDEIVGYCPGNDSFSFHYVCHVITPQEGNYDYNYILSAVEQLLEEQKK